MRGGVSLVERTVGLEVEKAYAKLKALLLVKHCKIIAEEAPVFISVRQGSLWGISPATAKKNMNYRLTAANSGTQITCSSSLASDWKNLTIIGCALVMVVASLCLWISMDLNELVTIQQQSYWSWIATVGSYIDLQTAQMFAGLTYMLTVFLKIILALEMAIVVYIHFRTDTFAEKTLNTL